VPAINGVVGLTDQRWFDFLSERATDGQPDEVNFWRLDTGPRRIEVATVRFALCQW